MLREALNLLRSEYRNHRMARFAFWILIYGAGLEIVGRTAGGAPGLLWFVFWACLIVWGIYYLARLWGFVQERFLWRLRNRLIVTYLFIAVVPILLIVLLVGLGATLINGQFAAFLVTLRLEDSFDELKQLNRAVVQQARLQRPTNPQVLLDQLQSFYASELESHAASYPGLEITLRAGNGARAFRLNGEPLPEPVTVPGWLTQDEFAGFVVDQRGIALRALARTQTPGAGELIVILSEPLSPELLDSVGADIGPVGVLAPPKRASAQPGPASSSTADANAQSALEPSQNIRSKSIELPAPSSQFDVTVRGASELDPVIWGGEKESHLPDPIFVLVNSRILELNRQLFSTLGRFSLFYLVVFIVVAAVFLVIEIVSLVIGGRLTRSMTTTVDRLHAATERVKAGDFSYRVNLPSKDQLSSLGEAFDTMTASVERLLIESREKSRLENELEIAREVQRQLFPREAPRLRGIELYGACRPARGVSGDYYDFLHLDDNRVGLVLGDVSGKGISAALLMAAIQAALRAQFYEPGPVSRAANGEAISTADVVSRLNRQLYESTAPEKYATFFYAEYHSDSGKLAYTNAGHPAPILLRGNAVERLETGGTVVGLISPASYLQAEVELAPGDLLLAFTDGLTEPENTYGEEFGEERLIEAARRALGGRPEDLAEEIYRSVNDWTGSPELQDDMTMLVARAVS